VTGRNGQLAGRLLLRIFLFPWLQRDVEPTLSRIAGNVVQLQSEGQAAMAELKTHLESAHGMFERLCGGKAGAGAGDMRMNELERLLHDTRLERDKLKRQLADMEDQLARYR
jgi:hypothetical protein